MSLKILDSLFDITENCEGVFSKIQKTFSDFSFIGESFFNRINPILSVSHDRFTLSNNISAFHKGIKDFFNSSHNIFEISFFQLIESINNSFSIKSESIDTLIGRVLIFDSFRGN